ncbi:DUF4282 domain-containing protein [Thermomonas sp.]|uniref:DUF4282 domain-containing protein n=1 Tax=Thermomonas sp. TaxID=1971895 RepID=UPI003D13D52F
MRDVFFLDSMLTPKIITLVYWVGLLGAVFAGLSSMFGGWGGFNFYRFLAGLFIMVAGAIGVRIWCELLIILFKIHENIRRLAER